jgi:hypothetical protein
MKRLAVIIASLFIPVLAQTSTTGNLNDGSWTNVYRVNELVCWQPGDPNCSPGIPYLRPGGTINYSYGMTDISQYHNVANVLPYSGTGLVVTGWHFQYTAKVGNGWDDGAYDYLRSYVNIVGKGNTLIEQANFVHTSTHDWYTFNLANSYSPLTSRYTTENLTRVGFGFIGQDYNGFEGPYGPEITNVSFTLNYQRDPCLSSQLVSPQCPGFMEAISKVSAVPKQAEVIAESPVSTSTINQPVSVDIKKIESTAQAVAKAKQRDEVKITQAGPEQTTENISTESKTTSQAISTAVEQTRTSQQSKTQVRTTSQNVEVATSIDNQQMDQPTGTTNKQSQEQVQTTSAVQTTSTNTSTTASVDTTSIILPNPPPSQQAEPEPVSVQVATIKLPDVPSQAQIQVDIPQPPQMEQVKPQVDLALVQPSTLYTLPQPVQVQPTTSVENVQVIEQPVLAKVDVQAQEATTSLPSNMLTDKTNPINDIVTLQPQMASMPTFSGPTVNQKAQDNDAVGGVSIAQMARTPVGFEAYNIALKDVAFYAPREIYRNQRTVDNARALRQLGSDRLHQEMVDQQYRR